MVREAFLAVGYWVLAVGSRSETGRRSTVHGRRLFRRFESLWQHCGLKQKQLLSAKRKPKKQLKTVDCRPLTVDLKKN
jgi:hypothetical protein